MEQERTENSRERELAEPELADEALGAEETTFKKRYGDLRRWSQVKLQEAKEQNAELQARLREASASKQMDLPKTAAELEEFARDYPDLFGLIETAILTKLNSTREEINTRFAELDVERKLTAREKAINNLLKEHPDLEDIKADPAFHEWAVGQSRMTRAALYENETDWQSASDAIYLYKSYLQRTKKPGRPKSDVGAAASVPTNGGVRPAAQPQAQKRKWSESRIKALTSREAEQYMPEIEAAYMAGEIEYDITGAAR